MAAHDSITKEYLLKRLELFNTGNKRIPSTHGFKQQLIHVGLLENKCNVCGLLPLWNNKPLSLHMDHVDGDACNNTLENLRVLCPNCHAQTDTFAGKNKKVRYKSKECAACSRRIQSWSNNCGFCAEQQRLKEGHELLELLLTTHRSAALIARLKNMNAATVMKRIQDSTGKSVLQHKIENNIPLSGDPSVCNNKPDRQCLLSLVEDGHNLSQIARQYNVSANAVAKWIKKYDISYKSNKPYKNGNK